MIFLEKLKAKRRGIRLQSLSTVSMESRLELEEFSRLGRVQVKLPDPNQTLTVGAYSYVRDGSEIYFLESIGRFCSIGRGVVLGQAPNNHPVDWVSTSMTVSKNYKAQDNFASIGHDVWVAHDAVIMAGVHIGTGAVIGRNAVVTKDVQPYDIVAGNPAKVIRNRFNPDQVAALLASRWWEYELAELNILPFDDVDGFLAQLSSLTTAAHYTRVSVSGRKVALP